MFLKYVRRIKWTYVRITDKIKCQVLLLSCATDMKRLLTSLFVCNSCEILNKVKSLEDANICHCCMGIAGVGFRMHKSYLNNGGFDVK